MDQEFEVLLKELHACNKQDRIERTMKKFQKNKNYVAT